MLKKINITYIEYDFGRKLKRTRKITGMYELILYYFYKIFVLINT